MKRAAKIILFLIHVSGLLMGQNEQYKFKHLTISHGLSDNHVIAIYKDRKGFLWFGTSAGLNRYDGHTIKTFHSDSRDSATLSNNSVGRIFGAPDGNLVLMTGSGLNIYDPNTERFQRNTLKFYERFGLPQGNLLEIQKDNANFWFVLSDAIVKYDSATGRSEILKHVPADSSSISADPITSFASDVSGSHWVIHGNGVVERLKNIDGTEKVVFRNKFLSNKNKNQIYDYRLFRDSGGNLWIWVLNDNQGVYHLDVEENRFAHFTTSSAGIQLNTNIVSGVVEDNEGRIWIGTDHGGINLIDRKDKKVTYIYHRDEDESTLGQNSINSLYRDDRGIIWIGTYKRGISYFHENIFRFRVYKHFANDPDGLPYSDLNRFVEDENGNIWIGTNGGGLIYFNREDGTFKQFRNDPRDPNSLSSNVIVSLCIDHKKNLWIGTYYGGLNMYDGKKFKRYVHNPSDEQSLSGRSVWEIFEDSNKNLWIGTLEGGVNVFDRQSGTFQRLSTARPDAIQSTYISAIIEDRKGNIWFGTSAGIDVFSPASNTFQHYEHNRNDTTSLSNNVIFDILETSDGSIWIATQDGLNIFDPEKRIFRLIREKDGLPSGQILTLEEDNQEHIWLGTANGLLEMIPAESGKLHFRNYSELDGLQSLQFNENASYKTRDGALIFGGPNGFNIFNPENIGVTRPPNKVVFTDFQLFQKSIGIGEKVNGRVILERSISESRKIVLPPGQNFFSIEFSSLNFLQPEKNEYVYKLEGLHADWLPVDKQTRKITFTNLSPKDYVLKVKSKHNEGPLSEPEAQLSITLLPPFYRTKLAFVAYLLFLTAILYIARKLVQQREKLKYAIEQERQEALRMHELDMMKIKFFTNVSHEFRTPLTLILTPLEKMLKQTEVPEQRTQYQLIQRNAKRLLTLVNQLLDFRKMEVQELRFSPSEGDILKFIHETVYSFSDLSEKKGIRLNFVSAISSLETVFDQDKLEKIIFNLLSNAFKFTPEKGEVTVSVDLQKADNGNWLVFTVQDTGIGIPEEKIDRIFDRFFQNDLPRSMVNQGSGIGLAITKEFVRICRGEITVQSEPGKGSCFTVRIPVPEIISEAVLAPEEVTSSASPAEPVTDIPSKAEHDVGKKQHALLLVEDNDDFRFYLKDNLKQHYQILEAADGEEGWKRCLTDHPDLVVSDVMMPRMSGIDLCRKIKEDERVSHVPVILLTARSAEEQRLEGFQTGADDYITKPFNFEILESRIKNLIALREKSHNAFRKTLDIKASQLNITPLDTKFIENAIRCVEQHVSSSDFSVEDLGRELGISRAYLYKKIVALTGKSPLEFIRTIRMQHAAQLLEKSQLTVAEVAYQVGFNNPKYFTKYFKEEFNVLPSGYAAAKRNQS